MRHTVVLLALGMVLCAGLCGAYLVNLNESNFKTMTRKGNWLVAFTKSDCPHCKRLLPELEKASENPINKQRGVRFGTVDSHESDLVADFDIRGYPNIFFLDPSGERVEYTGMRDASSFTEFIARVTASLVEQLHDQDSFANFVFRSSDRRDIAREPVSFVLVLPADGDAAAEALVADKLSQVSKDKEYRAKVFLGVTKLSVGPADAATLGPRLVRFAVDESAQVVAHGSTLLNLHELKRVVEKHGFPLVSVLGAHNFFDVAHNRDRRRVFVELTGLVNNTEQMNAMLARLRKEAEKHKDFLFGVMDEQKYKPFTSQFMDEWMAPYFVHDTTAGLNYVEHDAKRAIAAFLDDVREGKSDYRREGVLGWPYKFYTRVAGFHWAIKALLACIPLVTLASCFPGVMFGQRARHHDGRFNVKDEKDD